MNPKGIAFDGWTVEEIIDHYEALYGARPPMQLTTDEIKEAIAEAEWDI